MVIAVPTITTATADRVPVLAAVLARTFADDAMISWPFHDHDVEERAVPLFAALLREYVALEIVVEAGAGAGLAAWIPPGSDMGLEQVNAATWTEVEALTGDGGDRYHRFWNWLESFVPSERHWMLDMVGVDPDRQGEGIGTALVRHGVERARADRVPAFLETSKARNVPYYERFGFRTTAEEDAPGGGPHIWFMRLDP